MASEYDIQVDQGSDFEQQLTWKDSSDQPIDITGFDAKMEIRGEPKDQDPALVTLTVGAGITLGGAAGTILIEMTSTQTASLPSGDSHYDILLTDGSGKKHRFLEGKVVVTPSVTR